LMRLNWVTCFCPPEIQRMSALQRQPMALGRQLNRYLRPIRDLRRPSCFPISGHLWDSCYGLVAYGSKLPSAWSVDGRGGPKAWEPSRVTLQVLGHQGSRTKFGESNHRENLRTS
jgi:hypothetical protein